MQIITKQRPVDILVTACSSTFSSWTSSKLDLCRTGDGKASDRRYPVISSVRLLNDESLFALVNESPPA